MVTETKTYNESNATTVALLASPAKQRFGGYGTGFAQFVAIAAQFALIAVAIEHWHLESQVLARLVWLAFAGFIVHHLLPRRYRLPFFAILSLVAVITAAGHIGPNVVSGWIHGKSTAGSMLYHLLPGIALIAVGMGLIGTCHLPVRFGVRVGLIAAIGAGLAVLRAHSQWLPDV